PRARRRAGREVRAHPRLGRDGRRGACGDGRPAQCGRRDPHPGPVPAPDGFPSAGGPLVAARGVRRAACGGRGDGLRPRAGQSPDPLQLPRPPGFGGCQRSDRRSRGPGRVGDLLMSQAAFAARMQRVRTRMTELGVDALLLSIGADLPWLTGYAAMPLERLTLLVLPVEGEATLVVPALEAPRVRERPDFSVRPWPETEDPVVVVAELVGARRSLAVSDRA